MITEGFVALIDQVVGDPQLRLDGIDIPEIPTALRQGAEAADSEVSTGEAPAAPYDERLEVLRGIFSQVLGVEDVGLDESFSRWADIPFW